VVVSAVDEVDVGGVATPGPPDVAAGWRWLAPLYPVAPPSSTPLAVQVVGYVLGFFIVLLLALLRQAGVPATQTMWAEDGVTFYAQALSKPFARTLVTAYNGYDQLLPRLAARVARATPVPDVALVVALLGAGGLAAIGCLVFHMARGHIARAPLRALLVLAMVLLPVANYELLDNLVNLPWWLFFAAFWALLWRPRRTPGAAVAAVVCALAAASEPLVALLLPLAAARCLCLRRPLEQAAGTGLLAGLAFQLSVAARTGSGHIFPADGLSRVPGAFAFRVGLGWLTGRRATAALVRLDRPLAEALGVVLFMAVVLGALRWGPPSVRALGVAVAVLAPLCFVFPVWLRGAAPRLSLGATGTAISFASRYAATPLLMVISLVLVGAAHLGTTSARARCRPWLAPAVVLLLLLPAWVADFRDINGRMDGPTWAGQVAAATTQCMRPDSDGLARVSVTPSGDYFVIHCRVLHVPSGRGGATDFGLMMGRDGRPASEMKPQSQVLHES